MKRALFCIFAIFICMGLFAQQPVVAVAPFSAISGISATDANMITRVFTIRLGNTQKVSFVDRSIVERVLQEHKFQAGDWSNQQKTAELGKALNTDWIVRGELEKFGNNILVTVQFYDIQTFRFMGGADLLLANAEEAMQKMDPLVNKLIETIAAVPVKHPLFGLWGSSDGLTLEFKNDGTFICGNLKRSTSDTVRNSQPSYGPPWVTTEAEFLLTGDGTYTYTDGFLSLKYLLSGSKTTNQSYVPGTKNFNVQRRDNNYRESGSCNVSYSISADGNTLTIRNGDLFIKYRSTNAGDSNGDFSDYYYNFTKRR